MKLPDPALLVITDRRQARTPIADIVEAACAAGCRWFSVREKDLTVREQVALAESLLPITRRFGARLMLHGDAALAKTAGLDGVHLPAGGDVAHAYETQSKPGYGPARGAHGIAAIVAAAGVPILAIGGIGGEKIPELLRAGATGIAVMGAVMRACEPGEEIKRLLPALAAPLR